METNNKSFNDEWKMRSEELFTVFINMILPNPRTGNLEIRNEGENWDTLVKTIFRVAQGRENCSFNSSNAATGLKPLIPYAGGKTNELQYIYPSLPSYERFFEPFVGGGSVFMGINANEYFINDFSSELISLYENIITQNEEFCYYINLIDITLEKAVQFRDKYMEEIYHLYHIYTDSALTDKELLEKISTFCDIHKTEIIEIMDVFPTLPCILFQEMRKFLYKDLRNAQKRETISPEFFTEYLLTTIKKSLYVNYRNLFNNKEIKEHTPTLYSAIFLYIRECTFKSSSSYNRKGEYNSSYGGYKKNYLRLSNKIEYFRSQPVIDHFNKTHIYNLDFEDFLSETRPSKDDFIFLDPPYDETNSTYHGNEFNKFDHQRLANYLLNECQAKWMMIIKKTDFIYNLYNQSGIYIQSYEKIYHFGKMQPTTHLLITNYPVSLERETLLRAA